VSAQAAATTVPAIESDLEVLGRHLAGDERAFAELYRRFGGLVFNLAWRLSGDREEAADLTQEIFLRLFRHLPRFRGDSQLRTWVYRVALNHCRSRWARRRLATVPLASCAGIEALATREDGPERQALLAEEHRRLAAALAALPRRFRVAVVLRDVQGLAYDEIAEVLALPPGTVRSRIARGREQLRRLLLEEP
jgi:RNA polymerase sigma-70 factor (ECF subfamily)